MFVLATYEDGDAFYVGGYGPDGILYVASKFYASRFQTEGEAKAYLDEHGLKEYIPGNSRQDTFSILPY